MVQRDFLAFCLTANISLSCFSHTDFLTLPDLLNDQLLPSLLFVLFLAGVSPILKTLTESISTDTIWAMTVTLTIRIALSVEILLQIQLNF